MPVCTRRLNSCTLYVVRTCLSSSECFVQFVWANMMHMYFILFWRIHIHENRRAVCWNHFEFSHKFLSIFSNWNNSVIYFEAEWNESAKNRSVSDLWRMRTVRERWRTVLLDLQTHSCWKTMMDSQECQRGRKYLYSNCNYELLLITSLRNPENIPIFKQFTAN